MDIIVASEISPSGAPEILPAQWLDPGGKFNFWGRA